LNHQIKAFENACGNLESKYFERIFLNKSQALIDTIKNKLAVQFPQQPIRISKPTKHFGSQHSNTPFIRVKSGICQIPFYRNTKPQPNVPTYCTVSNNNSGTFSVIRQQTPMATRCGSW
jgi:hypothetical protein